MGNKEKYLKYKAKYLQLSQNQTGGLSWGKFTTYFKSKPTAKSTIEKYDYKIGIKYYYYDIDNIITFKIPYNGINYVINQVNLKSNELNRYPNNTIYCINLKDNIPHTLLLLSKNCEKIEDSNRVNPVRVNKRYYESNNYENDRLIISGIIEQIIIKCNNDKGLAIAFQQKKEQEERERSYAEWRMEQDRRIMEDKKREKSVTKPLIINQPIRSTIGSSVKIDTVNLPINEGLCYKQNNTYYGQFKKYVYDDSRGDPYYNYYFDNGIIIIDPMEKNNKDIVNVVECSRPEQDSPELSVDSSVDSPVESLELPVEGPQSYEEGYSDSSPERYSDKVTIDYIKNNQNLCYQYFDKYNKRLVYLGRYLRDERGSGRSDDINYHYFENGDIIEGDIKYFEIVNCGNNRSEV
jgi:hypothetical protein